MERRVSLVIEAKEKDLGGFSVRRSLPNMRRRMVGPFIFVDHFGPAVIPPNGGMDVRPHPHIGLATVTYLFEGSILHRDSVGSEQEIRPGAVNWMTAGRGIVHSERSTEAFRRTGGPIFGMQIWVALPEAHEETEPGFSHHPKETIPTIDYGGSTFDLVAGEALGQRAPAPTLSRLFYVHSQLDAGADVAFPVGDQEAAVYVVEGSILVDGTAYGVGSMVVFEDGGGETLCFSASSEGARVMILGGDPLGKRYIWWNLVASTKELIEAGKERWRRDEFPKVPGETERIPLPEA